MAIAPPRRRTHSDKHRFYPLHGFFKIGGECQPPSRYILRHQRIETRLKDRHFAPFEHLNLGRVHIDTDNVMPKIGEAHPRNKTHVSRANHRDLHKTALYSYKLLKPCRSAQSACQRSLKTSIQLGTKK